MILDETQLGISTLLISTRQMWIARLRMVTVINQKNANCFSQYWTCGGYNNTEDKKNAMNEFLEFHYTVILHVNIHSLVAIRFHRQSRWHFQRWDGCLWGGFLMTTSFKVRVNALRIRNWWSKVQAVSMWSYLHKLNCFLNKMYVWLSESCLCIVEWQTTWGIMIV